MVTMENAEEVMQILDRFTRLKQKEIPKELDEYLGYVAKTGDTVFKWTSLKYLFREKLLNVIKNFHDSTPRIDEIPQYPNVDPFNYESMKSSLLERLERFNAAPFTIQRLCELLIDPRKQYSRIDKYMRALEKNILVVSTVEPGRKRTESENGDSLDSVVNGDLSLDVNVDIEMESEGLFNNSESTNGNGNATKAEVEAAKEDAKTEETEKAVTKNTHANDDDNLPNPKKAKLDLPEDSKVEAEESKKTDESVANDSAEKTKMESDEDEKVTDQEKTIHIESENESQKSAAERTEENTGVLKDHELKQEQEGDTVKDETDVDQKNDDVCSKCDEKDETENTSEKEKQIAETKETSPPSEESKTSQPECNKSSNEVVNKDVSVEETDKSSSGAVKTVDANLGGNKENLKEETGTVVEKQEIEIGEKDQAKQYDSSPEKVEKVDDPSKESEQVEQKSNDEAIKESDDAVIETAIEAKEKENTTTEATSKEVGSEKQTESCDKDNTVSDEHKTENIKTDISDKVTEKQDIDSASSANTNTEAEVEKKEAATAEINITASASPEIVPTTEEKPEAAVTETKLENTTTPTLALNDQPMEDAAIDEESPSVDEVVMDEAPVPESSSTAAMATEDEPPSTAPVKPEEESSGMEVDDTSQEAMDQ
ncbi:serine/threonine-protein phosphatase 4 regulatory subunit 2 [Musca vetustissima]|uniref:serine/threonine-protein phosphatase 4 regulatory subunit 2 n=1 Tax=Musca vetustissima TaxID=27455 RepID=UPI002AB6738E|nr:serine/threonine-protein phosphatase 4 regulatory subunit 2 [Musca vetustissima]